MMTIVHTHVLDWNLEKIRGIATHGQINVGVLEIPGTCSILAIPVECSIQFVDLHN